MKRQQFNLKNLILFVAVPLTATLCLFAAEQLPTGKEITPTAVNGSVFQTLNPELPPPFSNFVVDHAATTVTSPDGNTLLILTSGYNRNNDSTGKRVASASNEYVFVYDISVNPPVKRQVLQVPNTFDGIAWNPNGNEFYVSGGSDDNVHFFAKSGGVWSEPGSPISLGHATGLGLAVGPGAAGMAVNASGNRLIVANYENDSISVIDIPTRTKIAELDLRPGGGVPGGEYPFWVAIKGDSKAYVSSIRDREIVVVNISNLTPAVVGRIPMNGQPNKMILNKAQNLLYTALDATDLLGIVDTASDQVTSYVKITAPTWIFPNTSGFKGSNPNSLALSPDEETLFVTNGGTNSLAVVELESKGKSGEAIGLIPTGWYPNSVSLNAQGSLLYIVNGKSNTGPNPGACRDTTSIAAGSLNGCNANNQYVWQLTKAGFLIVPVIKHGELKKATEQVAENNHFTGAFRKEKEDRRDGEGRRDKRDRRNEEDTFARVSQKIKHVIYIVKENRTYDQVLGDLEKGNGDPTINVFPEPLTPNFHQIARKFVTVDNFYDSGEVSGDGWNWSTSARAADSIEKTEPINYAGRGLGYDYEGTNRNINVGLATTAARLAANPLNPADPNQLPGTADVSAPDAADGEAGAGYLWDAALRANLKVRNYGFFIDLAPYSLPAPFATPELRDPFAPVGVPFSPGASGVPVQVSFPTKQALLNITDPYFRGYDNNFPDYWRFKEWEREFDAYITNGNLPTLELVRFPHDHFGNFATAIDGVNTVETQMADNDYAVGLLIDKVSHSIYKNNTVIFVIEDDSQDGPDHVDAHRSNAYIAGAYVKQGPVISTRYTTVNMLRTIEDLLGIQPLGINDGLEEPMADVFQEHLHPWTYTARVPQVLRTSALPLPPPPLAEKKRRSGAPVLAYAAPRHDANYWESKSQGLDFSVADNLDTPRFNRILWEGMMGDSVAYPLVRSGADLSKHRGSLVVQSRKRSIVSAGRRQ